MNKYIIQILAVVLLVTIPTICYANLIFPVFLAPYVRSFLLPYIGLWIIGSEIATGLIINRKSTKLKFVVLFVALANILSSIIGIIIGALLTLTLESKFELIDESNQWAIFASYLVAFGVSLIIEAELLRRTKKKTDIAKPYMTSMYCNTVSYVGIAVMLFAGINV